MANSNVKKLSPKVSIVTTVFKSEKHILEFYERCRKVIQSLELSAEILFIDDGSPDNSVDLIRKVSHVDSRVRLIRFTNNFGHTPARIAAMKYALGAYVFLIDCDLEESPEWLAKFYHIILENEVDVVFGIQEKRKGKFFEKISGSIFYWLLNKSNDKNIASNQVTARLMTRRYVDALMQYSERDIFLAELWNAVGFKQIPVRVNKTSKNKTTYTFSKKLDQAISAFIAFSVKPIYMIASVGLLILTIGFLGVIMLLFKFFFTSTPINGLLLFSYLNSILASLILVSVALIGLYISRIFLEVKRRPLFIIQDEIESGKQNE